MKSDVLCSINRQRLANKGFMAGDVVRDKDGVSALALAAEIAVGLAKQGLRLHDFLQSIYKKLVVKSFPHSGCAAHAIASLDMGILFRITRTLSATLPRR